MDHLDETQLWTPERFERLIEGIDAIVWEADAETLAFTYVSPRAEEMLGYPVESWLSDRAFFGSIIHPDESDQVVKMCHEASRRGEDHELDFRAISADGREVWLRDRVRVHIDLDSEHRVLRGVMSDITASKKAEEEQRQTARALRESERRLRTAFEDSAVGIAALGLDGKFIQVNQAFCRITGRSADELVGISFEDVTHPDDREDGWTGGQRLLTGEIEAWQREKRYLRPDGQIVWGQLTTTLIRDDEGEPSYLISQVLDITEKRQKAAVQSELAAIMRSSGDAIIGSTLEGKVSSWNQAAEKLFGYSRDEIVGKPVGKVILDHPRYDRDRILELVAPGKAEFDSQGLHKDGSVLDICVSLSPIVREDDEVVGIAGSVKDVSEQRSLEEQFRQAQKMEAIARLAGGVSHDFNNLLTAILGNCELLLDDDSLPAGVKDQVGEIQEAAEIGENVASQLLELSRTRVTTLDVLSLGSVLLRLESVLRRLLGEDVELVVAQQKDPVSVVGNEGQLEQVILNLAINARDAMPEGGRFSIALGAIEVTPDDPLGRFGLKPGRYAMLTATDTGTGMTPEVKERVFEPFFTTKSGSSATGLGLSTAYQIVSEVGGHITLDSAIGRGTTFTIYLPSAASDLKIETDVSPVVPADIRGTILLVEDDPRVRSVVGRILRADGHRVIEATDGPDALERFAEGIAPFDVVVTDVVMPGMGGPALVERLLQDDPDLGIIYISGYAGSQGSGTVSVGDGTGIFLAKPFKPQQLARSVREVLAGKVPR